MADIGNIVFESMLKEAVAANFRSKMEVLPLEEQLLKEYPPSPEHVAKMKSLFKRERRIETVKKLLSFTKAAVVVLCVAATVFFSALMLVPQVRATVRDAIVQFFGLFTQVEFTPTESADREVGSFSLRHIPDGYGQTDVYEYGDNFIRIYGDADGNTLIFHISPPDTHAGDTEHRAYRTEIHKGITYHIYEALDTNTNSDVSWAQNGFMFSLTGSIPVDELMKTAYSLK